MFIAIDLDAFYCGVEEKFDPSLRDTPFCVIQKEVVATLSYEARKLGIPKLSNVRTVSQQYPNMQLINGESLSKYRLAGKEIFSFVQTLIGGLPVERLGLEEMRFDLTDVISEMCKAFPPPAQLLQWLDDDDFMDDVGGLGTVLRSGDSQVEIPDFYFKFDGETWPEHHNDIRSFLETCSSISAYIGGHIAAYIRDRIWLDLGYSCSIGVAASKDSAKMVGAVHKPRGVTVLMPGFEAEFMKTRNAAKVPGLGRACRLALNAEKDTKVQEILEKYDEAAFESCLSTVIGKENAANLYLLSLGNDLVGQQIQGYVRPQQISMEESFATFCPEKDWEAEVRRLASEVSQQAAIDWYDDETLSWEYIASTARVSSIFANQAYVRKSRSTKFSWNSSDVADDIANKLSTIALPLLRGLAMTHQGRPRVINVALVL